MDIQTLKSYALSKKATSSDYPFGEGVLVIRVMGKMFALIPETETERINLKCDPAFAEILRQTYPAVTGAYHMNKKHWNTVVLDGTIPDDEILDMVDESYRLVVRGLKKAEREALYRET
jgi:predicted DNA-binding protein (MmcQ/YjbR family)